MQLEFQRHLHETLEVKKEAAKEEQGDEIHAFDIALLLSNNKNPKPSASPALISSDDDHASDDAFKSFDISRKQCKG